MVKSKKMSKTGIAVIVLAILLVLSMVMGLTGAWFTDKAASQGGSHGSLHFRADFMNVSIANNAGSFTVERDKDGDGTVEVYDLVASKSVGQYAGSNTGEILETDIMPGDVIKSSRSVVATFSAVTTEGSGAYYIIGKKAVSASEYSWYVAYTDGGTQTAAQAEGANLPIVNAQTSFTFVSGSHQIALTGANYVNTSQGAEIPMTEFTFDDFCVRMIQADNLTAAQAYEILTDYDWSGTDPVDTSSAG